MSTIRAIFEEIWPVPEGVEWGSITGCYFAHYHMTQESAVAHNARLDTFTRCQETADVYVSLVDELVMDLQTRFDYYSDDANDQKSALLINRAKQLLEQKK